MISVPSKAEVRKLIKETLINLILNNMLLDGEMGSNPTMESAANALKIANSDINGLMQRYSSRTEKDLALSRAYIRALKEAAKRMSPLAKLLKKNPDYLVVPRAQSTPKKRKSVAKKTTSKKKTTSRKKSSSVKKTTKTNRVQYKRKKMKNGKYRHYKVDRQGKMKIISKAVYDKRKR